MTRTAGPTAIIAAVFATGLYLNALGWLGNAILLREDWARAYAGMGEMLTPPYPPPVKELLTLVSDFVYAFALVWIYAAAAPGHPAPRRLALELILVLWLAAVGMTYLGLVNSGFLPPGIAIKSSLWALVTFLPLTLFLPLAFRFPNALPDG